MTIFLVSPGTSLIISNKTFNPRHFLLTVHRDTSYADLIAGVERLKLTVEQRSEALKALVHSNFDRFVSAKNTIDHVYDEMKAKKLNSGQEYGTRVLGGALSGEWMRRELNVRGVDRCYRIVQWLSWIDASFDRPRSSLQIKDHTSILTLRSIFNPDRNLSVFSRGYSPCAADFRPRHRTPREG